MENRLNQNARETKEANIRICKRLRENLKLEEEHDLQGMLSEKQMQLLYDTIVSKRDAILGLISQQDGYAEELIRGRIKQAQNRTHPKTLNMHDRISNKVLKKRFDKILDEIIDGKNSDVMDYDRAMELKVLIDGILEQSIDLSSYRIVDLNTDSKDDPAR